jgi:hypothetical protein
MKNTIDYLSSVSDEVIDAFMEDHGVNGWDLLTSGTASDAADLLKDYF